jgi:hypothetical protein
VGALWDIAAGLLMRVWRFIPSRHKQSSIGLLRTELGCAGASLLPLLVIKPVDLMAEITGLLLD